MSATDVASQPSGPNLQDIKGPTLEEPPVPAQVNPEPGPDGRRAGEDAPPPLEETQQTPSPQEEAIKVDIKTEKTVPSAEKSDTENIPDKPQAVESKDIKSETVKEVKTQKGSSKVNSNVKVTDKVEKDSELARTEPANDNIKVPTDQTKIPEANNAPIVASSRPLTETSVRDETKMSFHAEVNIKRESKAEVDRDSSKTPFSVTAERKPLHTAQTRSHSDYYSKTSSSNRYAHIASSLGQFYGFVPAPVSSDHRFPSKLQRMRRPPKLVRLATVTMSPKTKPIPRGPSLYYEEPKKPQKVITWTEANEARPPLRIDMEGPGPTQYSPRNRPLNETNSPAWTFGSRCFTEKTGGSRTSWEKTWFQTPEVWTSKVDFYNDSAWPTPLHYKARPMLGPRQRTTLEAPSFTIGTRKEMTMNKTGSDKEPSPADYDKDVADRLVLKKAPSFSHQFRREGTVIWASKEKAPGPGSYTPNYSYNKPHGPNFSIRSLRREKSHVLGPFSTF